MLCKRNKILTQLYLYFQKAFDSVDQSTNWKLLQHYGVPDTFISLIQQLYDDDAACQVIHNGKLTDPFSVQTGVRQGCMLSPMIFLMVVDWIMRESTKDSRTGIKWNLISYLEDLDFADDLCLMSQKQQHMQQKTNKLAEEAAKTGLQINKDNTAITRFNARQQEPITLEGSSLKEVDSFTSKPLRILELSKCP